MSSKKCFPNLSTHAVIRVKTTHVLVETLFSKTVTISDMKNNPCPCIIIQIIHSDFSPPNLRNFEACSLLPKKIRKTTKYCVAVYTETLTSRDKKHCLYPLSDTQLYHS